MPFDAESSQSSSHYAITERFLTTSLRVREVPNALRRYGRAHGYTVPGIEDWMLRTLDFVNQEYEGNYYT